MKLLFAGLLAEGATLEAMQEKILAEAHAMYEEDIAACKAMGAFGAALLPEERRRKPPRTGLRPRGGSVF